MQPKRYKPAGTAIGFKGGGSGLQIGQTRLSEQRKRETDAIRLAKEQAKEVSNINIGGLSDAAKFEEGVLSVKHKLRGEQRKHERGAWEKHYETQIAKLEGEAKELGKRAKEAKELAPKLGKNLGKLAQGTLNFADRLKGEAEWKALKASGFLEAWRNGTADNNYNIVKGGTDSKEFYELQKHDPKAAAILQKNTAILSSYWAQQQLLAWVKDNKDLIKADIVENFTKARGDVLPGQTSIASGLLTDESKDYKYQEHNSIEVMDAGARALLRRFGIAEGSATGSEIIDQISNWGAQDKSKLYLGRKATETKTDIKKLGDLYTTAVKNNRPLEERNLLFTNLVSRFQNGYFQNESGRINDPTKGERFNWGDASIEAAKKIVELRGDKITSAEDIFDLFEGYTVPNSKELLTVKHLNRFRDEVIPHWVTFSNKKDEDKAKLKEAQGLTLVKSITNQLDGVDGDIPIELRVKLNKEIEGFDTNEKRKKEALKLLGYQGADYNSHGKWTHFLTAIQDGDEQTWMQVYSTLPTNLKERAQGNLKLLKDLAEALPPSSHGEKVHSGIEAFIHNNLAKFKRQDKGKNYIGTELSETGKAALHRYSTLVMDEFERTAGSGVPPAVRLFNAYEKVDKDLEKGVEVKIDTDSESPTLSKYVPVDGNGWAGRDPNHWANFVTPSGGIPGVFVKSNHYYNLGDFDTTQAEQEDGLIKINSFQDINSNPGFVKALHAGLDDKKPIPFKPGTIKTGIAEGYTTADKVLASARFMSLSERVNLDARLDNAAEFNQGEIEWPGFKTRRGPDKKDTNPKSPTFGKFIPGDKIYATPYMARVIELGKVLDKSPMTILNRVLALQGSKHRISEDGFDVANLKNDNKPITNLRNVFGYNAFNAGKAQNILLTNENIRLFKDLGLGKEEVFQNTTGITWQPTPTGFEFSDAKGFIEQGGVSVGFDLTLEMAQSLGLADRDIDAYGEYTDTAGNVVRVDEGDLPTGQGMTNEYTFDAGEYMKPILKRKQEARKRREEILLHSITQPSLI